VSGESAAPGSSTTAGPRIYYVTSPGTVHVGQAVTWKVVTSHDVVAVNGHVSVYNFPFQAISPGHFSVSFAVPANVPPIFHGTYSIDVQAHSRSGATVTRIVSITFE
jgi:plastocyanin